MEINMRAKSCLSVLVWQRASAGARRYELIFDAEGRLIKPFDYIKKGPRYAHEYVALVRPGDLYYDLYLRLTNIKEGRGGPKQNKYGRLEVVTYEKDGLFGDYFDMSWWSRDLADYPLCRKVVKSIAWYYSPWEEKKDPEAWRSLPTKLITTIGVFKRNVEYYGDLDSLIRDLESPQTQ